MESGSDTAALLLRGVLALGRRVRAARPAGALSLSGLGILGTLNRLGPMVATRLAAEERLQPQSLTRLLADLERDELITRRRNEEDRRAITLAITVRGRGVLMEDMAARRAWLETALQEGLQARERGVLLQAAAIMVTLAAYQPDESADA